MRKNQTLPTVAERITAVQSWLKKQKFNAVVVPTSDPHNTEYLPDHWCLRAYLSGFTGSAGTLVVTPNDAFLWTDFRYWIQGANELEGTPIELMKDGHPDVKSWSDFLIKKLGTKAKIAFDPMMFMASQINTLTEKFAKAKIELVAFNDFSATCWPTRPEPSKEKVFDYGVKYAGKSRQEKIANVREKMKEEQLDILVVSSLYDIAWLFNLRGNDTPCVPIFTAFTTITPKNVTLYLDEQKVSAPLAKKLKDDGVEIKSYLGIVETLKKLKPSAKVGYTSSQTPATLSQYFPKEKAQLKNMEPSIIAKMKAVKNATEIKWAREARVHDGVALVRFFAWLDRAMKKGEDVTEFGAAHILNQLRLDNPQCKDLSFHTIAGYNANAALCHYQPSNDHPVKLEPKGLLLVDSGGQYLGATTDVTRTVALGKVNPQMMSDFTLTLKGHLAIARQRFPVKTRGSQFDTLARTYMWNAGINFGHGTGHGIGAYLNVHEGPPGISVGCNEAFEPGMMVTNEPGIYREGKHGIRIENVILVIEDEVTDFGAFYKFEPLTYCPYDTQLIQTKLLTDEEIKQINAYHKEVYQALESELSTEDKAWLKRACAPLKKG